MLKGNFVLDYLHIKIEERKDSNEFSLILFEFFDFFENETISIDNFAIGIIIKLSQTKENLNILENVANELLTIETNLSIFINKLSKISKTFKKLTTYYNYFFNLNSAFIVVLSSLLKNHDKAELFLTKEILMK